MPRSRETSERMRAEARERILVSAGKLFAERGYFNCKVSDVARAAGMSQGNIFWYFPGKEMILKSILADGYDRLEAWSRGVSQTPSGAREKLDALAEGALALYENQGEFFAIQLSILAHGGSAFLNQLGFNTLRLGAARHQSLNAVFNQAREEGLLEGELKAESLSMLFFSLLNGLVLTYGPEWRSIPREALKSSLLALLGVKIG